MSLVNLAQVKGTETLKNDVQKMLKSYDALKQTCEANKAYVDKKVADLVNGAPEQLDTLQELSKALNNDKDYATTVNNALAEKLGKTEKAVSAKTADSVPWTGVTGKPSTYPPSSHNHDSAYPATNGSRATGTWDINITGKANTAGTADNATKANTLTGFTRNDDHTWGNETGELVANFYLGDGAEIAFRKNNPVLGSTAMLIDGVVYQNEGLYKCIDENSINDYLAGAGIVSQQLGQDVNYIKYANGLLVQKIKSFIAQGVNITGGCKVSLTLPVAFKDINYAAYTTVHKDMLGSSDGPFICYFAPVSASKVDIIITNGRNNKDFYEIYVVCIGSWK